MRFVLTAAILCSAGAALASACSGDDADTSPTEIDSGVGDAEIDNPLSDSAPLGDAGREGVTDASAARDWTATVSWDEVLPNGTKKSL
ncbi:MAG: hypothetical protein ABI461_12345 [Polyangiaceae bacterium]